MRAMTDHSGKAAEGLGRTKREANDEGQTERIREGTGIFIPADAPLAKRIATASILSSCTG